MSQCPLNTTIIKKEKNKREVGVTNFYERARFEQTRRWHRYQPSVPPRKAFQAEKMV
jgi:hypothetical protein